MTPATFKDNDVHAPPQLYAFADESANSKTEVPRFLRFTQSGCPQVKDSPRWPPVVVTSWLFNQNCILPVNDNRDVVGVTVQEVLLWTLDEDLRMPFPNAN